MPSGSLRDARDAAQKARQLSHDHDRNHRDADPRDTAIATRGSELRRLADEATAKHGDVQRTERAADAAVRRDERAAYDAGLQGRLRAESQARRDAAAPPASPAPRGRRAAG